MLADQLGDDMHKRTRCLGAALAAMAMIAAAPASAGTWKYELQMPRESPGLNYVEDSKTIFSVGCGHAFAVHIKYPGTAKKDGAAVVTIAAGRARMTLKGEFEEPFEDFATTFVQWDLGYRRQDPALYSKKWDAVRDRLFDLLESGRPINITGGNDSYKLPPVEIEWRRQFEKKC